MAPSYGTGASFRLMLLEEVCSFLFISMRRNGRAATTYFPSHECWCWWERSGGFAGLEAHEGADACEGASRFRKRRDCSRSDSAWGSIPRLALFKFCGQHKPCNPPPLFVDCLGPGSESASDSIASLHFGLSQGCCLKTLCKVQYSQRLGIQHLCTGAPRSNTGCTGTGSDAPGT